MEDDHTEESSDGTLARGDDHSNYTHKQEYVEVIDADVTWRMIILRTPSFDRNCCITCFGIKESTSYGVHMRKFFSSEYIVHI
jgi:hypothetical protein